MSISADFFSSSSPHVLKRGSDSRLKTCGNDAFFITLLWLVALFPRLLLLSQKWFEIFHSDQAIIGIMGRHILQGKPMVYFYGQGYMGSLEAFAAAFWFQLFGSNLWTLQLAPLSFYLMFLAVNFILLEKIFGRAVSVTANLLLALSPPSLTALSVTALGGYPETLFFGSLVLLGFVSYRGSQSERTLFLTALAAGIGLWVNSLILMYFLAAGLFFIYSRKGIPWKKILFLEFSKLPFLVRLAALTWHGIFFLYLLWNLAAFFLGTTEFLLAGVNLHLSSVPFQVKIFKFALNGFAAEIILLSLFLRGPAKLRADLYKWRLPITGFLLGSSPAWLYSFIGGEGYRVVHSSGMIYAKDLPKQIHEVLGIGIGEAILGFPSWPPAQSLISSLIYFLLCALPQTAFLLLYFWRNLTGISAKSYTLFPLVQAMVVISICLFNTLVSYRYLMPAHFGISLMIALAICPFFWKKKALAATLLAILLTGRLYTNLDMIRSLPSKAALKRDMESVLTFLEQSKIRGAYAVYDHNYIMTFLTKEKIIVAPYRGQDRYPSYTEFVDRLDRAVYLFRETDEAFLYFKNALASRNIPYEMTQQDNFYIYFFDRTKNGLEKNQL